MKRIIQRLLSPDPAEGTPAPDPAKPPADPVAVPLQPPADPVKPSPLPAPPLVAKTALEGTVTEREAALTKKLKDVETANAELAVENQRLKTPKPTPDPSKEGKTKKHWLEGGTFFD